MKLYQSSDTSLNEEPGTIHVYVLYYEIVFPYEI